MLFSVANVPISEFADITYSPEACRKAPGLSTGSYLATEFSNACLTCSPRSFTMSITFPNGRMVSTSPRETFPVT